MITDAENTLSDVQPVTASAASTNAIDMGPRGVGDADLTCEVIVDEAAAAAGAATVTFAVEACDAEGFGSGVVTLHASAAIGKAALTPGAVPVRVRLGHINKRYMRVYYTVATGPLTAGKFTARLLAGAQTNR